MRFRLAISALVSIFSLQAQPKSAPPKAELQYVAILSRHGIRTPLWNPEEAQQYVSQPWPTWDVPIGNLTARGKLQMQLLGAYYRALLTPSLLSSKPGCADASRVYFYADSFEREVESARAIATNLLPTCDIPIHSLPLGQADPLFKPREAGVGRYSTAVADAELAARLASRPEEILKTYLPGAQAVEEVLLGCKPSSTCPPSGSSTKTLPSDPIDAVITARRAVDTFLMEYQDGRDPKEVGWGRVDLPKLRELQKFKNAADDLLLTSYAARATSSNLLDHVLRSLRQAASGQRVAGAMGQSGDKVLVMLVHDTDIQRIARMLELSWVLDNNPPRETPPGCSLIFELWRDAATGKHTVKAYFQTPALAQIHDLPRLTLKNPPLRTPLLLPAEWESFQKTVQSAIDPSFVAP